MALRGNTVEEQIYNYLYDEYKNHYGAAGLMGNVAAESGLNPKNLQNSFEKKLGYTDDTYTAAVDNGTYTNFVRDSAGYGLAQWTYWSRKQNMLNYHQSRGKSIGDLETQLSFLVYEIKTSYKSVDTALRNATSVKEASNVVLLQYEKPADQSIAVQEKRASLGQGYYDKYAKITSSTDVKGGTNMSNSSLVGYTALSPNHSGKRTKPLTRLTPHCFVGQVTKERIGSEFAPATRKASCNYGIAKDGTIVLVVDEANRSWCSSNEDNDQRAITFECASDSTHPYAFNDVVYNRLIELCADICKRNGKTKVLWLGSKEATLAYTPKDNEMVLTAHRWFAAKACPGDWLYSRYGELADKINAKLGTTSGAVSGSTSTGTSSNTSSASGEMYRVRKTWTDSASQKGAFTSLENAKKCADANKGYSVFNNKGEVVYPVASSSNSSSSTNSGAFKEYQVRVDIDDLNIRMQPTSKSTSRGYTKKGVFTIVEEADGYGATKWGLLKSYKAGRNGWISLDFAKKV